MVNFIHPTAVLHPDLMPGTWLGMANYIGPYCVIGKGVRIGDGNRFEAYVSVGQPAEKTGYLNEFGSVEIGNGNTFREFVTVNGGTTKKTKIGNFNLFLRGSHVSHDTEIEDEVTVSCNVMIGGESVIMRCTNLGLGAILHQRSVIGAYSMLGMATTVTKGSRIYPGNIYVGSPARLLKRNVVAFKRFGITEEHLYGLDMDYLGRLKNK